MAEVKTKGPFTAASLLAMNTVGAKLLAAGFIAASCFSALTAREGVESVALLLAAIGVVAAGMAGLLLVGGDPLPLRASTFIAATGPVACGMTLLTIPAPLANPVQINPAVGGSVVTCAFLCVRGRTSFGWVGLVTIIAMFTIWSTLTNQGPIYGLTVSAPNIAVLGMSTLFALIVRPAAETIDALQAVAIREAEDAAATDARRVERDAQRAKLNELAQPTLKLIAAGKQLDAAEVANSMLTEAQLRDSVRARTLDTPPVVLAARQARRRGVEVVLLDDKGMNDVDDAIRIAFCNLAAARLNATTAGTITIRIHPPARPLLGSIVMVRPDGTVERETFNADGRRHPGAADDL